MSERVLLAQQYLRAVYGGAPAVLDELAAPEIVISYPLFADILGTPALRGREAAKGFATRFATRWTDSELDFHDSVWEGDKVVLIWSFAARRAGTGEPDEPTTAERHAWGGITLIRFDGSGNVVAEIGEESTPGPAGRLHGIAPE
ncbi:nuclear transport factor 2 family protein [bacterium]|nr:nuclear transport factor 2 family protein [bacterium]